MDASGTLDEVHEKELKHYLANLVSELSSSSVPEYVLLWPLDSIQTTLSAHGTREPLKIDHNYPEANLRVNLKFKEGPTLSLQNPEIVYNRSSEDATSEETSEETGGEQKIRDADKIQLQPPQNTALLARHLNYKDASGPFPNPDEFQYPVISVAPLQ
jgi:hypothetical protein